MKTIAVWSTNEDKISGIKLWLESLKSWQIMENLNEYQIMIRKVIQEEFWWDINVNSFKTESEVSDLPTSLRETMEWARNRAIDLIEQWKEADYYIWTEWWIYTELGKTFLISVVAIISSSWTIEYWKSNSIPISKKEEKNIKAWMDLSEAFKKEHFSIPKWSVSWAYTMWKFSREKQFSDAFTWAIMPFCNSEFY